MNIIIIGRLFQAAFVKPKNPTNNIHHASTPLWRSSVNKAAKKNNSTPNFCEPPTLYCRNCRKYKNFGHKPEPPKTGFFFTMHRWSLILIPFCLFFNWKLWLYYFKRDWYDKVEPEKDLEHLYPSRPKL